MLSKAASKNAVPPEDFIQAKIGAPDEGKLLDQKDLDRIRIWYQNLHSPAPFKLLNRDLVTKIAGLGFSYSEQSVGLR